ncbi:MAG TPA: hypothetical protein PLK75_12380 [Bacteroidales bacterium]|nr:hypothetical protein [Bacteroidales bacterium]
MKKIKLAGIFLILLISGVAVAQSSIEPDPRLKAIYSEDNLQQMKINTPVQLDVLNFNLDHSWFIVEDAIFDKVKDSPYLYYVDPETGFQSENKVTSIDFSSVNIALYWVDQQYDRRVFYRVGDTGIVLGFYSSKEMVTMYNQSKNQ